MPSRGIRLSTAPVRIAVALVAALCALAALAPVASADRTFSARFSTNDFGDVTSVGNTILSCPGGNACDTARAGGGTNLDDNDWTMSNVDVDGNSGTFNSSRATLTLPAGATVLWAGLYWGADTNAGTNGAAAPTPASRDTVRFVTPAATTNPTASVLDSTGAGNRYQGFADVTTQVQAGGSGQYTVGNVQAGTGEDRYGGWSLVVAYRSGTQERDLRVYDGFQNVNAFSSNVTISLPGLLTPASGTVRTRFGLVAYESDRGLTGDTASLGATALTNAANPADNVFNSSIADTSGANVTTRSPAYVNQLGYDADWYSLDGALGNNATSATLTLDTASDVVMPGVVGMAINRAPTTPSNGTAPTISGTPTDGQTLTATGGTWTGTPTITLAYQWQRCNADGTNCTNIGGATGTTYTLTGSDVDKKIRVVVTATNPSGTGTANSAQTSTVAGIPPANTVLPAISGSLVDGQTVSVSNGTWTGSPTITYAYQWRRCDSGGGNCADIGGATSSSYTLTSTDVGKAIRAVVTASNSAGSASATTAASNDVAATPPVNTVDPSISGTVQDGQTLTADRGTWTGTPTITYAYQWQRCDSGGGNCQNVSGATATTYALTSADVGSRMRVVVTATNAAGNASDSATTGSAVAPRPPVNVTVPTVTGTPRDGQTLTADQGTWTGSPTISYAYQWQRCDSGGGSCQDVSGATSSTYGLAPADVGSRMRVVVTATNAAGNASAASVPGAVVEARAPVNTVAPTLSGTVRDGERLTVDRGTWTGTPTISYAYQWQRCDAGPGNCVDLDGETGTSYDLVPADVGQVVRVVVTATNAGGTTSAATSESATVAAAPPANVVSPSLSGDLRENDTLTGARGDWTGTPDLAYTSQWQRCAADGTGGCEDIPGATASEYTLTADDVDKTIRFTVTATNAAGSATAASEASPAVVAATQPPPALVAPANVTPPVLSGDATVGGTVTGTDGTWTGTEPLTLTRQWLRCDADGADCQEIDGATGSEYVVTAADAESRLRLRVSASNAAGTASATSEPTVTVPTPQEPPKEEPPKEEPPKEEPPVQQPPAQEPVVEAPQAISPPVISGTQAPGQTLTATTGEWSGTGPLEYGYQWQRCNPDGTSCVPIPGATSSSYVVTPEDDGYVLAVVVSASNAAGSAQASTQAAAPDDLGALPGSLVSASNCVLPSRGLVGRGARLPGLGAFKLRVVKATGPTTRAMPLRVRLTGRTRGLRSARFKLDGRTVRVRAGVVALPPALLSPGRPHRLVGTLTPRRGPARPVSIDLRTSRCSAVFTANRRKGARNQALLLRVDSRDAVRSVSYGLPASTSKTLRAARAGARVGYLRLVASGGRRLSFNLAAVRGGALLSGADRPTVRLAGGRVAVSNLPAGAGIVTVSLTERRARRSRAARLRADVATTAGPRRLTFSLPRS